VHRQRDHGLHALGGRLAVAVPCQVASIDLNQSLIELFFC
jgi:hypothetical protein